MKFKLVIKRSGETLYEADLTEFFVLPDVGELVLAGGNEQHVKKRSYYYNEKLCTVTLELEP